MDRQSPLLLVDAHGVPFPEALQDVLTALVPRLLRQFPQLQDPVLLVELLEEAGHRVHRRQHERGPVANVYGFAWVTVRNVTLSRLHRGSSQVTQRTVPGEQGRQHLASLPTRDASPDAIERRVLVREAFAHLSPHERLIVAWKQAGCSSAWIGARLGRSSAAIDTAYTRAKYRLRLLLGGHGTPQVREDEVTWGGAADRDDDGGAMPLTDVLTRPSRVPELRPWIIDEDL